MMSPFYLSHYNSKIEFNPSDTLRGVDVHPHKGFETVAIAYHGKIATTTVRETVVLSARVVYSG